ncbi:MAG: TIGR01212 family radical SAM protein [Gemmatimonadetes bacterium]|nr:MAG: TIGR01212 family radical SAM protein [Gemmatimonadota bacterium]
MISPYFQYKDFMQQHYGTQLHRIPLDMGDSCPNRLPDGSGGCTFCNLRGSRAIQTLGYETVYEQVDAAIRFAQRRYRATQFIAYIQAFSATFGAKRQQQYLDLLSRFPFRAVVFGTRPDYLTRSAYAFLQQLNESLEVWVELGVQTVHDRTLRRINRGHDWSASERAIQKLHDTGLRVAVHVILGLPGETPEDFQYTANTLASLPISGVKIHNLHIEKGTTLAKEHALTPVPTLMEYEYAEHLMDFIRRMPPDIPIMRIHTDTLPEELIAPKWHMDTQQFKAYVIRQMVYRQWRQGDLYRHGSPSMPIDPEPPAPVATADGSITFWSADYKEHYHAAVGARTEALEKFIRPSNLIDRLKKGDVRLLDVCFGLGYNSLMALDVALATNGKEPLHALEIVALEMDKRVVQAASQALIPLETDSFCWQTALHDLVTHGHCTVSPSASIDIRWGDARFTASQLQPHSIDIIYLDAFSTQRNSELWTVDFFRQLRNLMKADGVLITYCAAIPVRSGLLAAGFQVGETPPVGRDRGGTIAAIQANHIPRPLPANDRHLIEHTTRGIPYRDPYGVWTNTEILRHREAEILKYKQARASNRIGAEVS